MRRSLIQDLVAWRSHPARKPLVLRGARQTGKTHLLSEFGRSHFRAVHRIDFQEDPAACTLFAGALTPRRLVSAIELYLDTDIDLGTDLLFLDELQDCPRALTSLKFFCEQLPELAVCSAGSLLGVVHAESSFPVGKVHFLDLHPLSFLEFGAAVGEGRRVEYLQSLTTEDRIPDAVHATLMELVRCYFVVGGMPEAVNAYAALRDHPRRGFEAARTAQRDLVDAYVRDFAKYADAVRTDRILAVFEGLPAQLAKANKKFIPTQVRPGTRHATFQSAVDWLVAAGLVHRVPIANSGELPFSAFTVPNRFKLYPLDVGLLGRCGRPSDQVMCVPAGRVQGATP